MAVLNVREPLGPSSPVSYKTNLLHLPTLQKTVKTKQLTTGAGLSWLSHLGKECLQVLLTIVVLDVGHIHCSPAVAMRTLGGREGGRGREGRRNEGKEGEKIQTDSVDNFFANCETSRIKVLALNILRIK